MAGCNIYQNLGGTKHQMNRNLGWTKSMKLNIILLLRLKKENQWAKDSKYITPFDYFDNSLIVTTGSVSIASFTTVIGTPVIGTFSVKL